jgi:hypothetical protein
MKNLVTDFFCSLPLDFDKPEQSDVPCSKSLEVCPTLNTAPFPSCLLAFEDGRCKFASCYCLAI